MNEIKATEKTKPVEVMKPVAAAKPKATIEPVYPVTEYIENAKGVFGVSKSLAAAAFNFANKQSCTRTEAKNIIEGFKKRSVK